MAVGIATLILSAGLIESSEAQNRVGIGTNAPSTSALLDLTSTSSGLLAPRLTNTQMLAVATPSTSLIVYNTTYANYYYFDGTVWRPFLSATAAWQLLGNAGTVAGTNCVGTTDNVDFRMSTNNTVKAVLTTAGYYGQGTLAPVRPVEVIGDAPTNIHTAMFRAPTSQCGVALGGLGSITTFGSVQGFHAGSPTTGSTLALQTLFHAGNVGIKIATPKTKLDVNGDMNLRESNPDFSASNGNNNDVALNGFSHIRINSPGSSFTITGLAGGYNGKVVILYNSSNDNMTVTNDDANSAVGNRIYTLAGNIVTSGTGSVTLIYNATAAHWVVLSATL